MNMKRILTFIGLALAAAVPCTAQMQALFGYSTFYLPGEQSSYVETYLQFDAWTMAFEQQETGVYRATVEVTLVARTGDSVCFAKKYDLNSPTVASLDELDFSFLDLQRFALGNGVYTIDITLRDKGSEAQPVSVSERVVINYDNRRPSLSSVQTMSEATPTQGEGTVFSRHGYDMEPYVSDFFPEQVEQLNFYYEVYNIDLEVERRQFLAMAYIEQQETGVRMDGMQTMSRKYSAKTVPVYGSLDISGLPSGNYNLVVELRNRDNQTMLYSRLPFFRSNPGVKGQKVSDFALTFAGKYNDETELNTYLDALYPIASPEEVEVSRELIRRPALEEKQAFLYRFWSERSATPEAEWLKYKERVDYVQAHFSYPRTPGIHTDRGRVYLQYGPPDFIRDEKNFVSAKNFGGAMPVSNIAARGQSGTGGEVVDNSNNGSQGHVYYLPYQLWRYNKLETDDANRVFLFWDEHRSGYYTLLNSNAKGEVQEIGWERRLSRQQLAEGVLGEVGEQFNRGY